MRIVHVLLAQCFSDGYGYQENYFTRIHKQLGYDVYVLASTETRINQKGAYVKPSEYINEDGIIVKRIPYVSWLPSYMGRKLRLYSGTREFLERINPEIVFIHGGSFLDIKKIAKYVKVHKTTVFVDCHDDYINSANNWFSMNILHRIIYRWCYQQIIPFASKFYGTLPIRNKFLNEVYHVPKEKIELLPMGVDLSCLKDIQRDQVRKEMRDTFAYSSDDFVVVTGGKLEQRKNTIELIKAVLSINNPHIKLFLFGSLSDNIKHEAQELIQKHGDKVVYGGWSDPDKIYRYLLLGDLCFFPGTHSAIWEQVVGLGMPCVFKHWDNITHIDLGGNCALIDDTSEDGIAKEVLYLFDNRDLLSKMRSVAELKGPDMFSYEEIAKRAIRIE